MGKMTPPNGHHTDGNYIFGDKHIGMYTKVKICVVYYLG